MSRTSSLDWCFVDGFEALTFVPDVVLLEDSVDYKLRPCCGFSASLAVETEDEAGFRWLIGWLPVGCARIWREPGRPVGGCRTVKDWMERSGYVIETQTPEAVEARRRRTR